MNDSTAASIQRAKPAYRVLAYRGSLNLGDAIQTYAMARLLPPPLSAVYRCAVGDSMDPNSPFVVNGWLGESGSEDSNCLFAGVYIGGSIEEQIAWIARSRFLVGVRDQATARLLQSNGVQSNVVGCATMTFPRYDGPRSGTFNIDVGELSPTGAVSMSQAIPLDMDWPAQWQLAQRRLALLRTAELVYTKRLHVVLPCLAFGTPVFVPKRVIGATFQPDRLLMLEELGVEYDRPFVTDISAHAQRFKCFISEQLCITAYARDDVALPVAL